MYHLPHLKHGQSAPVKRLFCTGLAHEQKCLLFSQEALQICCEHQNACINVLFPAFAHCIPASL